MTTAKNEVFIGLKHENCYLVGGIHLWCGAGGNKNFVEVGVYWGGFFQVGGGRGASKFSTGGGTPPSPSRENPFISPFSHPRATVT